jgi:hypothetical protein
VKAVWRQKTWQDKKKYMVSGFWRDVTTCPPKESGEPSRHVARISYFRDKQTRGGMAATSGMSFSIFLQYIEQTSM